jgi:hypothetical protein
MRQRAGSVLSMGRKRSNTGATTNSEDPKTPRKGSTLRPGNADKEREKEREREAREADMAERDDEIEAERGYGRAFGAGQNIAPPEIPRV